MWFPPLAWAGTATLDRASAAVIENLRIIYLSFRASDYADYYPTVVIKRLTTDAFRLFGKRQDWRLEITAAEKPPPIRVASPAPTTRARGALHQRMAGFRPEPTPEHRH